jgi:hypothetical protein
MAIIDKTKLHITLQQTKSNKKITAIITDTTTTDEVIRYRVPLERIICDCCDGKCCPDEYQAEWVCQTEEGPLLRIKFGFIINNNTPFMDNKKNNTHKGLLYKHTGKQVFNPWKYCGSFGSSQMKITLKEL